MHRRCAFRPFTLSVRLATRRDAEVELKETTFSDGRRKSLRGRALFIRRGICRDSPQTPAVTCGRRRHIRNRRKMAGVMRVGGGGGRRGTRKKKEGAKRPTGKACRRGRENGNRKLSPEQNSAFVRGVFPPSSALAPIFSRPPNQPPAAAVGGCELVRLRTRGLRSTNSEKRSRTGKHS